MGKNLVDIEVSFLNHAEDLYIQKSTLSLRIVPKRLKLGDHPKVYPCRGDGLLEKNTPFHAHFCSRIATIDQYGVLYDRYISQ